MQSNNIRALCEGAVIGAIYAVLMLFIRYLFSSVDSIFIILFLCQSRFIPLNEAHALV